MWVSDLVKVTETADVICPVAMRAVSLRAEVQYKGLFCNLLAMDLCEVSNGSFFTCVYLNKPQVSETPIPVTCAGKRDLVL